jgi:thiamine pyrophosphate-dependent acetolactate synthase large subunit-like protein
MGKESGKKNPFFNFNEPRLDFCKMAQSMGVSAGKIEKTDGIGRALKEALASKAPYLLEVNLRA